MDENKIREQYDTEIKNLELQRDYLLKKIELLSEYEKKGVKTVDDAEGLMKVLCYRNLAFCCRPKTSDGGKKCLWRDSVLNILGVSKEDFIRVKEEATSIFYPKLDKKKE